MDTSYENPQKEESYLHTFSGVQKMELSNSETTQRHSVQSSNNTDESRASNPQQPKIAIANGSDDRDEQSINSNTSAHPNSPMRPRENRRVTFWEREQMARQFQFLVNIEKGYLFHALSSTVLCLLIQLDLVGQMNFQRSLTDCAVFSLLQNLLYLPMLSQILQRDSAILKLMRKNARDSSTPQEEGQNEQEQQYKQQKQNPQDNEQSQQPPCDESQEINYSQQICCVEAKRELNRLETSLVERDGEMTFVNLLVHLLESPGSRERIVIVISSILFFAYYLTQNIHVLSQEENEAEAAIRFYLVAPAIVMILSLIFQLFSLVSECLVLIVYGLSILFLLTHSVITNEYYYQLRNFKLKVSTLAQYPELINHTCAICIHEFEMPTEKITKLSCSHTFHYDCIHLWIQEGDHCPVCRSGL